MLYYCTCKTSWTHTSGMKLLKEIVYSFCTVLLAVCELWHVTGKQVVPVYTDVIKVHISSFLIEERYYWRYESIKPSSSSLLYSRWTCPGFKNHSTMIIDFVLSTDFRETIISSPSLRYLLLYFIVHMIHYLMHSWVSELQILKWVPCWREVIHILLPVSASRIHFYLISNVLLTFSVNPLKFGFCDLHSYCVVFFWNLSSRSLLMVRVPCHGGTYHTWVWFWWVFLYRSVLKPIFSGALTVLRGCSVVVSWWCVRLFWCWCDVCL